MPGPVSDSYDPVFGTASRAHEVRDAIGEVLDRVNKELASDRLWILNVVRGGPGNTHIVALTERELRLIRFALDYTHEII